MPDLTLQVKIFFPYHDQLPKLSFRHLTEHDKRLGQRVLPVQSSTRSALDGDRDDYDNEQQNGQSDGEKAALHLPGS